MSLRLDGRNPLAYMGVNPTQPPQLVVNKARPTTINTNFNLGTLWLIPEQDSPLNSMELWMLLSLSGNVATWVELYPSSGGSGASDFITDSGTASQVGGDITIHGGSNIGTTGAGSTVTINLDNTVSVSGSITAGTDITSTSGDIVTLAGEIDSASSMTAATTITAGTGVQVTTGDVAILAGNLGLPTTSDASHGVITSNGNAFISRYNLNTFVGVGAGNFTAAGVTNSAFGEDSLHSITSGDFDSAFGINALHDLTTAGFCSAFGASAGENITTGSWNTAIGYDSLGGITTGSANVALGYLSGNALTGTDSSNVLLASSGVIGDNNTIRIGDQGSGSAQQNKAYMAGVYQASVGGTNEYVIVDSVGKLGSIAQVVSDVPHGGTGDTSFTAYAVITGGTTSTGPLQNVSGVGTSGQVLTSNGAAALPSWQASGAASGSSILGTGGAASTSIAQTGTTAWIAPFGIISSTKAERQFVVPATGTISKLYVNATSNASTTSVTITLNVNGVNSALVTTITAATTGIFSDLTHTVSVTAGDTIQFESQAATFGGIIGIISALFTG